MEHLGVVVYCGLHDGTVLLLLDTWNLSSRYQVSQLCLVIILPTVLRHFSRNPKQWDPWAPQTSWASLEFTKEHQWHKSIIEPGTDEISHLCKKNYSHNLTFNLGRATVAGRSPKPSTVFQCIPPIRTRLCNVCFNILAEFPPIKLPELNRMRSREQHFRQKKHPSIPSTHLYPAYTSIYI